MKTHILKTWKGFFEDMREGKKTFEVRRNDREFQVGDTLELREWDREVRKETGRVLNRKVIYIMHGPAFGLEEGHCIMGIAP